MESGDWKPSNLRIYRHEMNVRRTTKRTWSGRRLGWRIGQKSKAENTVLFCLFLFFFFFFFFVNTGVYVVCGRGLDTVDGP